MVSYHDLTTRWNPALLEQAADALVRHKRTLLNQQDELDAGKVPDTWEGDGAVAATGQHQRLVNSLNDIVSPLSTVIAALDDYGPKIKTAKDDAIAQHDEAVGKGYKVHFGADGATVTVTFDKDNDDLDESTAQRYATNIQNALSDAATAEGNINWALGQSAVGSYDGGTGTLAQAALPEELRGLTDAEVAGKMLEDPERYSGYVQALTTEQKQELGRQMADQWGDADDPNAVNASGDGMIVLGDEDTQEYIKALQYLGDDPTVATSLLNTVGPDGLMNIQQSLFESNERGGWFWDDQTGRQISVETMGDAQRAWGDVLAAATKGTTEGAEGTTDHVSDQWINDLLKNGGTEYETSHSLGDGKPSAVGYQLLGPLLRSENHGTYFLNTVGDSMEKYETDILAKGGIPWYGGGQQVDFTQGVIDPDDESPDIPTGEDPFGGFFEGLSHNPEAAQQFLTGDFTGQIDPHYSNDPNGENPRVNYYMNHRLWTANGEEFLNSQPEFANALVAATTEDVTDDSAQLAESAIHYASVDSIDDGDPDNKAEMPDYMEKALADITAGYMPDVFLGLGDGEQHHFNTDEGAFANFDGEELKAVLNEIGHNDDALNTVYGAASEYAAIGYNDVLSNENLDWDHRIDHVDSLVNSPFGNLVGALDDGHGGGILEEHARADAAAEADQRKDDMWWKVGGYVAGKINGYTVGEIPFIGGVASDITGAGIDAAFGQGTAVTDVDTSAQARDAILNSVSTRGDTLNSIAQAAVYRNLPPEAVQALPDDLVRDGKPIPMDQWTQKQADAWIEFKGNNNYAVGADTVANGLSDERDEGDTDD